VSEQLLAVSALYAGYGHAIVLEDVSFTLEAGDSLAVLGRNGMGKTTLLTSLMGLTQYHRGSIRFAGSEMTRRSSYARARAGLGWVPQERAVFPSLTVEEHLDAVARPGPWNRARAYELFPSLAARRRQRGLQLSGGEQQMLAIARALVVNPRLLLLDEPMEGLAPIIVQQLALVVRELVDGGNMAVILVEQHARLALALTRQVLVLERGRIVHRGESSALADDTALQQRLLAFSPAPFLSVVDEPARGYPTPET
jgi:branched-chain amino acid transport system ATP-binding protein